MKLFYIADPYRADSEYRVKENIRDAERAALTVWNMGAAAICPHKNTAFFGGARGIQDETWLKGDIEILSRCDAVYALYNWRDSKGATAEIEYARQHNIPVFVQEQDDFRMLDFIERDNPKTLI